MDPESTEYPEAYFFFGYPPEQAEEFFKNQLHQTFCLCTLGVIWREQWLSDAQSIPIEAEIRGV